MQILADLAGDQLVNRRLVDIANRATGLAPVFREVGRLWMDLEKDVFASGGSAGGRPWAPLAPATLEAKARAGYPAQPLRATGRLMRSLTVEGAPDQILAVNDDWMVWGTGRRAAGLHRTGTSRMPARPPVQISSQGRRQTVKVIQRFVVTGEIGRSR